MTSDRLFRLSGAGLVAGAVIFIVHIVLRSVVTTGGDPISAATGGWWVPINALGVAGALLVLLGLPAMYLWLAGAAGLSGLIGVILLATAWLFFGLFLSVYALLVLPWLAAQAPSLIGASAPLPAGLLIAFILGLLAWLIGAMLIALPFLKRRVQPRWVGYLLPFSAVWVLIGNFIIAPSGPATNLAVNLSSNLGPVLLLIGIGHLGRRMSSGQPPSVI